MNFKRTILLNGVRVITVPMQGNPTVTVMMNVATGSYYENQKQSGISHFLEHMCFKGTTRRPSARVIATELDSIGASYNAFTTSEMTGYYAKADVRHFAQIADVVADIYMNSTFPDVEIAKEKNVVLGEIDMYADDPQEKVSDALRIHMHRGEPAERSVLGTKETVNAITRDDLLAYHTSQYRAENTIVTIAGGISEREMLSWAKKSLGTIARGLVSPELATRDRIQPAPEMVFVDKDTDQAHIITAWRTFDRKSPDRFVAHLIWGILRAGMSSRLFTKLRDDMGSGYYIGAHHSLHLTFGRFVISTGTTAERVPEIVSAILSETKKLKTKPVLKAELDKVKEYIRAHTLMSLETSDNVADFFADQEILSDKIRIPAEFDEILGKITSADIMRVANILFDNQKLTVGVIGKGMNKGAVSKAIGA
ncbi:MAG: pitrilysin family protein [bacterium]|nr:pitrilysin family protein [bacterium]